jgi:hypothetical protein
VRHHEITQEASPNTWAGSFTPDLVSSKTWLTTQLKKQLAGESAGDIYVLGSWWGNMGVFVQQAGIEFDRLIMVERRRNLVGQHQDAVERLVGTRPPGVVASGCSQHTISHKPNYHSDQHQQQRHAQNLDHTSAPGHTHSDTITRCCQRCKSHHRHSSTVLCQVSLGKHCVLGATPTA